MGIAFKTLGANDRVTIFNSTFSWTRFCQESPGFERGIDCCQTIEGLTGESLPLFQEKLENFSEIVNLLLKSGVPRMQ